MTQETLENLLGRDLTADEIANKDLYMQIADERLMELLCVRYDCTTGKRKYLTRNNYRSVSTDIFNTVYGITIDGVEVTDYQERQNNRLNSTWYNTVVFKQLLNYQTVEIDADWGFLEMPKDMLLLRARMFDLTFKELNGTGVTSKNIEDYSVTYNDKTAVDNFVNVNQVTINKYSNCGQSVIEHGEPIRNYYGII